MPLTDKQQRFVEEYLVDLNATAAAQRAGYKHPNKQGPALLVNLGVAEAIQKAKDKRSDRTEVTADRVLKELARVAFLNPRKVMKWGPDGVTFNPSEGLTEDEAACVSEASETITEAGGTIKVKLLDKLRALELIGKHLGMFVERLEVKNETVMELVEEIVDAPGSASTEDHPPADQAAPSPS